MVRRLMAALFTFLFGQTPTVNHDVTAEKREALRRVKNQAKRLKAIDAQVDAGHR
jgi:uncharacterized protein YbjQ (UPF0145 family)